MLTAVVGLVLLFVQVGYEGALGRKLVKMSYDIPLSVRPDIVVDEAVIIYIDEFAHEELGQDPNLPWDRGLHAQLIDRLREDGAETIVMDIVFGAAVDPEANIKMLEAIQKHGRVVVGADYVLHTDPMMRWEYYPSEHDVSSVATNGVVTVEIDHPDYTVRQFFSMFNRDSPEAAKPLVWVAAELEDAEVADMARGFEMERWINYYGPPGHIPYCNYAEALRRDVTPPTFFAGKTVFVGAAPAQTGVAGALRDQFNTSHSWSTGAAAGGVEIHATMFLNLLRGDWLRRLYGGYETCLIILLGLGIGYLLCIFRPMPATVLALGCVSVVYGLNYFAVVKLHFWFPWLIVVAAQIPAALTWSILLNSVKLYLEKRTLEESLKLHLSPTRAKQLLKEPDLLKPGAEKQEVTIIFTDIANFSKITGRMNPGDLFQLLNDYFEAALGCIHKTDGTVIKLIGDAIFALWNAPFEQKDHQVRACRAALLLRDSLVKFDMQNQSLPLATRIGLHTSEAYIGNVGSTTRFDYTAIGDGINLASRLEGLNKFVGTDVLATRDTQRVVQNDITSRLVGHFRFKGFDRVVEVHELVDFKEKETESAQWRETFERALFHFQRQAFDEAEAGFNKTIEQRGDTDGPSRFYLEKIRQLRVDPPPPDWAGEVNVTEK